MAVPATVAGAGSKATGGALSIDDETTRWTSKPGDGTPSISYRLAQPSTLMAVALRLSGWKERSHRLRIKVDEAEVSRGLTPRSLGYVTLLLAPHQGSVVKVDRVGAAGEGHTVRVTEVANQAIVDTGANTTPKGTLAIVDVEFYRTP